MNENKLYPNREKTHCRRIFEHRAQQRQKSEYSNGKILTTNNSNRTHNLIVSNITIAVGSRLGGQKSRNLRQQYARSGQSRTAFPIRVLSSSAVNRHFLTTKSMFCSIRPLFSKFFQRIRAFTTKPKNSKPIWQ